MIQKIITCLTLAEFADLYYKIYGVKWKEASPGNGFYEYPLWTEVFINTTEPMYSGESPYSANLALGYLRWLRSDKSNEDLNLFFANGCPSFLAKTLAAMAIMGDIPHGYYLVTIVSYNQT